MVNTAMDWPIHPIADLFPIMTASDYEAFKEDVRLHGVLEPVILWKGQLVDGRNRVRAARELGLSRVPQREERCTEEDLPKRLMSLNLHRRHLTTGERAIIAVQMANMKRGFNRDAEQSNPPRGGLASKPLISQTKAAEIMQVGTTSIHRASRLLRAGDPALISEVRAGRVPLTTADRALRSKKTAKGVIASRRGRAIRRTVVDENILSSLEGTCGAFAALDFSHLSKDGRVTAVAVLTRVIQKLGRVRKLLQ